MKYILGLVFGAFSCVALGQSSCQQASGTGVGVEGVHGINLNFSGSVVPAAVLMVGVNQWNGCGSRYVPHITLNGTSTQAVQVMVNVVDDSDQDNHVGAWNGQDRVITIFTRDSNGRRFSDAQLSYIMGHELGHALGLDDTNCGIMNGFMSSSTTNPPKVATSDCTFVISGWIDRFLSCQKLLQLVFHVVSPFLSQ